MSVQQRRAIAYWFTLIAGIAILGMQIYKYFTGALHLTWGELIVSAVAVVLMRNPNILSDGLKNLIKSKTNDDDVSE